MSDTQGNLWQRLDQQMEKLRQWQQVRDSSEILEQRRKKRAEILSKKPNSNRTDTHQSYLHLTRGNQRYALALEKIIEIHLLEQACPVPGSPDFIRGVIHWRGSILSLLDLGPLLQIEESGLADFHFVVVVESAGKRVGIIASEVEEIIAHAPTELHRAPVSEHYPPQWIAGVIDQTRLIIDTGQILQDERLVQWRHEHEQSQSII